MPATANHVLTVHSIRYNEQKPENSNTFVAFDTCSNYGGHLSLSVSGTSCSSEATGRGSGIAGLLMSMATQEGVDLTAEEAIQLFKTFADDIDVPEGKGPDAKYYFSHPGFDQRFGYGRANAFRIVEAIKNRMIPPEVDIVSPEWFAPIHADRTNGSIAVMGRVVAARAKAYDFKVQWAPGVQPEDKDYQGQPRKRVSQGTRARLRSSGQASPPSASALARSSRRTAATQCVACWRFGANCEVAPRSAYIPLAARSGSSRLNH
jgi:hypothetical protein